MRDYSVSYYGYSVPSLFREDGELLLCVGSESGKLFLFEGVDASGETLFKEVPERWESVGSELPLHWGRRSAAAVADLNGDGLLEVVVGNLAGGLQLFNADIPVQNLGIVEPTYRPDLLIFPNPVSSQLHIISKEDRIVTVMISDLYGREIQRQGCHSKEAVMDVSDWSEGVYLLTLVLDRGLVSRIFIKR